MNMSTELTQVTLGIDRLYRAQAGGTGELDREGLVPVILTKLEPASLTTWNDADARLVELERELDQVDDRLRQAYWREMIDSLRGLVATFRGDPIEYAERVRRCLRVDSSHVPSDVMDRYQAEIERLLVKLGYPHGPLAERVRRWEEDHRVPPEDVPGVLKGLLAVAKERTDAKMFALPDGLDIEPVGVRGVPFSAYCGYVERQLRINVDYIYTRSALKHLACHEAFPGHLVHLHVREERTRSGAMPPDAALVVTNSASSPIFEGIGENGIYFLDWIEDDSDLLAMALNRLRSAARVNAALAIHQDGRPLDRVKAYLLETCFVTPAWVESRTAFLTHRLRAPFIFAYWGGDLGVEQVWQRVGQDERRAFFQFLYEHMHTPATLDAFWPRSRSHDKTDSKERGTA